ncbi:MAG TPA: hypothetical protein VII45_06590, partial [Solirubrobacterales bacterium]
VGDVRPSPDFSHYFFSSGNVAMAPGGLTGAGGSAYDNDVAKGTVAIVSKLPGGGDIPHEPTNNSSDFLKLPAASTDGSHILIAAQATGPCGAAVCPGQNFPDVCGHGTTEWTDCPGLLPSHLYMRVNDAVTYDVSKGYDVRYEGMSADGSKVYFTSAAQVTGDDHDHSIDLFVWSEETDSVTRVSVGSGGVGDTDACTASWIAKCGVQVVSGDSGHPSSGTFSNITDNSIAAASGDIYFYSPEQFDGSNGIPGHRNLYVYRGGQIHYVAALDASRPITRIQVSPDGAHAAFVTPSRLTAYDNAGFDEMYSFDPAEGAIICVSCLPNGEPPTADVKASKNGIFMSDDGRTFFATEDALVAQDTDSSSDVYEYVSGRAQLITSGTGISARNEATGEEFDPQSLIGVSADGVDVYFVTKDTLVSQDHNGAFVKLYDARISGGFAAAPAPAPCAAADECHGPGSTLPPPSSAASVANLGSGGNVAHSGGKKHRHKKHGSKRHRKHHSTHRRG